jgi:hypothetical protein
MAVEAKIYTVWLGVMKVVTVAFGPDDIESATRAIAKSLVDGNIQL